jgi:hypothetical protein
MEKTKYDHLILIEQFGDNSKQFGNGSVWNKINLAVKELMKRIYIFGKIGWQMDQIKLPLLGSWQILHIFMGLGIVAGIL